MQTITTANPDFTLRHATPDDAGLVVQFMKKLGTYQKMEDKITTTPERIAQLLEARLGEALLGSYKGEIVGFVYFCTKSSAFSGRAGLYIDAFFVDPEIRHQGLGKIIMGYLCTLAQARGCEYMEWGVLDWNAPAIEFYRGLGAYSIDDMTIFRFTPEALAANVWPAGAQDQPAASSTEQ